MKIPVHLGFPWCGAIGNFAEEVYFHILAAQREGKRPCLMTPIDGSSRYFKFFTRGHFPALLQLEIDSVPLFPKGFLFGLIRLIVSIEYYFFRVVHLLLCKIRGSGLHNKYLTPDFGHEYLWRNRSMKHFNVRYAQRLEWQAQIGSSLNIKLSSDISNPCKESLIKMGIGPDDWYVCLHVRDSGFHGDHGNSDYRNADIDNYIPAIKYITSLGGWVVRLGDNKMKPISDKLPRLVDYPFTEFKSNAMDIFLIENCRLYIGSQSGIWDVANLFQKPILMPNMEAWLLCFPPRKGDLGIPKHVYSKKEKKFLSIREVFLNLDIFNNLDGPREDFELVENSPDEILELVQEFFDVENQRYLKPCQKELLDLRISQGEKLLERNLYGNNFDNLIQKYRLASRLYGYVGTYSSKYLEKYFDKEKNS